MCRSEMIVERWKRIRSKVDEVRDNCNATLFYIIGVKMISHMLFSRSMCFNKRRNDTIVFTM